MRVPHAMRSFFLVLLISACGCSSQHPSEVEESSKFADSDLQQIFIEEMARSGLKFKVDANNSIWYRYEDREYVSRLRTRILDEYQPSLSVSYQDTNVADALIARLTQAGIKHRVWHLGARTRIGWTSKDDAVVRAMIADVDRTAAKSRR